MELTEWGYGITTETDSMNGIVKDNGAIVYLAQGESAWSEAERYAYDLVIAKQYG